MKPLHALATLALILCTPILLCFGQQHGAISRQGPIIPEIEGGQLDHELVVVEGFVELWEEIPQSTVIKYHLRDKWANTITVLSPAERPVVKTVLYRVTGTVNVRSKATERFIDERSRVAVEQGADLKQVAVSAINYATPVVEERSRQWWYDNKAAESTLRSANVAFAEGNYDRAAAAANQAISLCSSAPYSAALYVVIAAIIVFVVLIAFLVVFLMRKPRQGTVKTTTSASKGVDAGLPPPAERMHGDVISMAIAPSGTLKILPGRFEVIGGDPKVSEIRLYKTSENPDLEFTFGRLNGQAYRHIQIDNPTVSHEQAKLLFNGGKYTLINRADPDKSNTTLVNDVQMSMNEVHVLNNNDKITMGAIVMRYLSNGK